MKLIIFDLDGTLYDTSTSFIPAVRKFLTKYDIEVPPDEDLYRFIGEPELVFMNWIDSLHIGVSTDDLIAEFDSMEKQWIISNGKLYDGVEEVLDELKSNGYIFGLCSNGPRWYIDLILKKFDIARYFDIIRFPNIEDDNKSAMVKEILDNLKPKKAFLVGDRVHDMEAAKENGMTFIGASYGFDKKELKGADYMINSAAELKKILKVST